MVVLAALAFAAWRWGPDAVPQVEAWLGRGSTTREAGTPPPSPELAETTLDRLERFRAGKGPDVLRLGDTELSSMIRFALPGLVPPGVDAPTVHLHEGRVSLSARVAVDAFPDLPALDKITGLLPDTVDLVMEGTLGPWGKENLALTIDHLEASRIPLPNRLIPQVLKALGRKPREGLPADALVVPLPEGLASAYILKDSLVLVADR